MRLADKVVLVTGGTRGIGEGIVRRCAAEGAAVAFTGRSEDRGAEVEAAVRVAGGRARYVRADNGREEEVAAAVQATVDTFGSLTTLVNNAISDEAGAGRDTHVDELDDDVFEHIMRIAVQGSLWASKHAIPLMEAAGGGSIMTLSYLAADRVVPKYNVMATAKAALECNVRYLASELGPSNIRVNAISAGPLKTLAASAVRGISTARDIMEEKAPLRRNVTQDEVGNVGLFLASPLSSCVTGETIYADCGFSERLELPGSSGRCRLP